MIFGTFFSNAISVMLAQAHVLNWALCLIFVFALAICLARGGWKLRSTAVFTVLVFGFSIAKPMISSDLPQWPLLLGTTAGERYFYITNFAFFCFVLYLISKLGAAAHKTLFVFSLALIPLFIMNFRITALPDVGYHEGLARLRTARVGEIVTIRLNPGGLRILTLQKK